jgi:hypothetical protein
VSLFTNVAIGAWMALLTPSVGECDHSRHIGLGLLGCAMGAGHGGCVGISLPVLVYLLFQRHLISGLALGTEK